ncbi:nitroreductase family deazaflavin-dependent oxidoreductase [Nocardia sp. NPDC048505]|uniref:nitroreductase family deazaflavin-dependent oxidoreductase n=1 Tax=unclassified Nocardia TaxID=2637762 RepID=UPI0033DFFAED
MTSLGARLLRTRWFVRAPIGLFRAGLGFVFGSRLLLLEHIGRKSGEPRYVALETVAHISRDRVVIASGFGATSQWYRNLRVTPRCHVWIGARRRVPAVARVMEPPESAQVLAEYRIRHPRAYRKLSGLIEESTGRGIDTVPLLALDLR